MVSTETFASRHSAVNMEKFVLRGEAAAALAASVVDAPQQQQRKRQRQTTIHHGDKVVVEERVQYLKEELEDAKTTANMRSVLEVLEKIFVPVRDILFLIRYLIALLIVFARVAMVWCAGNVEEVQERARKLLRVWKSRAKKAMRRRARRVETYGRNFAD
ncbi:hypothetical protein BBJ28_00004030 [Nothophytophthora sp. Chile5]|nr:hypothetical protein BBJ28_00004030 [Nothophytophthora sp. Chile5]